MYDPIADKLLIVSAALILIPHYLGFGIVFVIMLVEMILVGSAYYLKQTSGKEIRANAWGKGKMIMQSLGVVLLLLFTLTGAPWLLIAAKYVLYVAVGFGVVSLVTYGI